QPPPTSLLPLSLHDALPILTSFGVRNLRFDSEHGFFLNDRHVEIYGAASHQDFPGVGIAPPDDLWAWRIQKLKAMGANAYRAAQDRKSTRLNSSQLVISYAV